MKERWGKRRRRVSKKVVRSRKVPLTALAAAAAEGVHCDPGRAFPIGG